jgi:hypothetical protein
MRSRAAGSRCCAVGSARKRAAVAVEHDRAAEQSGADRDADHQEVPGPQAARHGGDGERVQCLGERAGDGVRGDDGGQCHEAEHSDHRQCGGTEKFTDRTSAHVEHSCGQRIGRRTHLAHQVGGFGRQYGRAGPAFGCVIQQHERVLEEPRTEDQQGGQTEQTGMQRQPQQHRKDRHQQQRCCMERQGQGAQRGEEVHAAQIIAAGRLRPAWRVAEVVDHWTLHHVVSRAACAVRDR